MGTTAAAARAAAEWDRFSPSTRLARVRALRALLYYRTNPLHVLFRAAARTSGAAPIPSPPPPLSTLLQRVRALEGPAADAVLFSLTAGGARFASIRAMRQGDANGRFVILRQTKCGGGQRPIFFPTPRAGWMRARLSRYFMAEPAATFWADRPHLFPGVTDAQMRRVLPARQVRRAAAVALTTAAGSRLAADALGNTPKTVRAHYAPAGSPGAQLWCRVLSSESLSV